MDAGALPAFSLSFIFNLRPSDGPVIPPTLKVGLVCSINPFRKYSHKHNQEFIPTLIVNIKLIEIKIIHPNRLVVSMSGIPKLINLKEICRLNYYVKCWLLSRLSSLVVSGSWSFS